MSRAIAPAKPFPYDDLRRIFMVRACKTLAGDCSVVLATFKNRTEIRSAVTAVIPRANSPKQFDRNRDRVSGNGPTANHIVVGRRLLGRLIAAWTVRAAKDSIPMGFDRASHRSFVGSASGKLPVFDATNGGEAPRLDIAAEGDGVPDDTERPLISVSPGASFVDFIRQQDVGHYSRIGQTPSARGAARSLFVAELDQLHLAVPAQGATPAELLTFRPCLPTP